MWVVMCFIWALLSRQMKLLRQRRRISHQTKRGTDIHITHKIARRCRCHPRRRRLSHCSPAKAQGAMLPGEQWTLEKSPFNISGCTRAQNHDCRQALLAKPTAGRY